MQLDLARALALVREVRIRFQGGSPAQDARAEQALALLRADRVQAETRIAELDPRVGVMATSRAGRRRNWTPRSAVIAAIGAWRALRRNATASVAAAGAGALIFSGAGLLPLIHHAPAPRTGHATARAHQQRRRMTAVTTSAPGRHRARRLHHGPASPPGGTVGGTPVRGNPPAGPTPPAPPVKGKLPVHLPKVPPVQLPPVSLPKLPPVKLPPVGKIVQPILGTVGGVVGKVTGTAGQVAGTVTGTAGGVVQGVSGTVGGVTGAAGSAGQAVGSLLGH